MNFQQIKKELGNFGLNNPLFLIWVAIVGSFGELRRPHISFFTYLSLAFFAMIIFFVLKSFFKINPQAQQYFRPKSVLIFNSIFLLFGIFSVIVAIISHDPMLHSKAFIMEFAMFPIFFGNFLYFGLKR